MDEKGHGGFVLTVGNGYFRPVMCKSSKSKINCTSPYEYELAQLHLMLAKLLWLRQTLDEIGYKQDNPSIVFEDNMAVINTLKRGKMSNGNSKHIHTRLWYAKVLADRKQLKIIHCPSERMIAVILTKPLVRSAFVTAKNRLIMKKYDDYYHNLAKGYVVN